MRQQQQNCNILIKKNENKFGLYQVNCDCGKFSIFLQLRKNNTSIASFEASTNVEREKEKRWQTLVAFPQQN